MTRVRRLEWEVLRNERGAGGERCVALGVERQAERQAKRHSGGALLLSVLRVLWECQAEFDVRTATTLFHP
jgi:hypothetical protein